MANERNVNAASTTNVRLDGGKTNHNAKKNHKSSEEMLLDSTPREMLTSHQHLTTVASNDEHSEEAIDITVEEEWVARVEMASLEENDHIHKELEGHQRDKFKMKEAISSLEYRLMEALRTINTMRAKMKTLKDGVEVGGLSSFDRDR
uniref:Uncharacterized protein n=1 Tax=Solanum tuberosum TaxID=4113 RepID=M1DF96_SOLTU